MTTNERNIKIHLVILEGPDGVGKSTLQQKIVERCYDLLHLDDLLTNARYLVMRYAAGKMRHPRELEPDFYGITNELYNFHGSQMEVDLHRFRYSKQMNTYTQQLLECLALSPTLTDIVLIQDRSWVSSVVYNANNTFDFAKQHHNMVIGDMLKKIKKHVNEISYNETYIFVGAEDIDTIREHKKKRSEDDYYERLFPLEVLIPAYARKLEQVKLYCTAFGNKKVIEFVNDYDPKIMANFVDAFIEDNLK